MHHRYLEKWKQQNAELIGHMKQHVLDLTGEGIDEGEDFIPAELSEVRKKIEKHIKDTYLKKIDAPQREALAEVLDGDLVSVLRPHGQSRAVAFFATAAFGAPS